jgi:hypothetical protein
MTYWGLNSVSAPNSRVGQEYLYDYVVRELGRTPEFWGRYIGFSPNQIQQSEIDFLRGRGCRIAFLYNGVRRRRGAYIRGSAGYRSGGEHAEEAVRRALALNVPHNVRIYCDLEGWRATPEWLRGWWDTMYMVSVQSPRPIRPRLSSAHSGSGSGQNRNGIAAAALADGLGNVQPR